MLNKPSLFEHLSWTCGGQQSVTKITTFAIMNLVTLCCAVKVWGWFAEPKFQLSCCFKCDQFSIIIAMKLVSLFHALSRMFKERPTDLKYKF